MNRERLVMLLEDLKELKEQGKECLFNMARWGKGYIQVPDEAAAYEWEQHWRAGKVDQKQPEVIFHSPYEQVCGTTVCAAGLFAVKHPECGLEIVYEKPSVVNFIDQIGPTCRLRHTEIPKNQPVHAWSLYACMKCFDLDEPQAEFLFLAKQTLDQEIQAVEAFLEYEGIPPSTEDHEEQDVPLVGQGVE